MNLRFLFLLVAFIFNIQTVMADEISVQEARFLPNINKIGKLMSSSEDSSEVLSALLKRARVPAFDVQGMARFYRKKYPFFKGLHRDFKRIEDFVGKVDQWENELRKAKSKNDDQRIEKAEKKLDELNAEMIQELTRRGPSFSGSYEADNYPWMAKSGELSKVQYYMNQLGQELSLRSYDEDRKELINFQLKNISDIVNEYNPSQFDNLELENGIHPFRKDLRWILIEMRVSNGLFTFDPNPNNCDVKAFSDLPFESIAKSKYSKLGQNDAETKPCYIQQCLFLGVTELQNKVADIKDEIEDKDVVSEKDRYKDKNVPKSYRKKMDKLYGRFLKREPWKALESQLKSCLKD